MQHELLQEIIEKLNCSQELIERSSFETINQHDKIAMLLNQLTTDLGSMMSQTEAMNYTLEDTVEILSHQTASRDDNLLKFSKMLEEQGLLLIELSQLTQKIMEEQASESDAIHEMEEEIAKQREIIDLLEK